LSYNYFIYWRQGGLRSGRLAQMDPGPASPGEGRSLQFEFNFSHVAVFSTKHASTIGRSPWIVNANEHFLHKC